MNPLPYPYQIQVGPDMITVQSDTEAIQLLMTMSRDNAAMAAETLAAQGRLTDAVSASIEEQQKLRKQLHVVTEQLDSVKNGGIIAVVATAAAGMLLYRQVSAAREDIYQTGRRVNRTRRAVDAVQRSLENHDARVTDLARPQRG